MLLLDVVMVFRRNVPRWARVFDDDEASVSYYYEVRVVKTPFPAERDYVRLAFISMPFSIYYLPIADVA